MQTVVFTPRPVDGNIWEATRYLPRWSTDDTRVRMELSIEDHHRWNALKHYGEWIALTDQRTGLAIEARRADCGAPCACAAEYRLRELEPAPPASRGGVQSAHLDRASDPTGGQNGRRNESCQPTR